MDMEKLRQLEKTVTYMSTMRPVMNRRALFADTTPEYVTPAEPEPFDKVTVRFRTAKDNVDCVLCVYRGRKYLCEKIETVGEFDYYACELQLDDQKAMYHFEVISGKLEGIYDRRGLVRDVQEYHEFTLIPGFHTPDWAKGAVMYQIYVDRFCNGDPGNDVLTGEYHYVGAPTQHVDDWGKYPAADGIREFYGGDLQGVMDKLDYLQDLGVEVIYFNPLFVSPSNHKYDIQDYDYIDPHVGRIVSDQGELLPQGCTENRYASRYIDRVTNKANLEASNQLFAQLVEEAHKRGMKVILDGVFNHCGSFNKWMDRERIYENAEGYAKGAYVSGDSPYRSFFDFRDQGRWPYNPSYDGWWGYDTLPKLNYENSQELFEYILQVGRKWVSPPYNMDGWRLDVAADLGHSGEYNHFFWQQFRKAVKEANPNAIVLAEHYGNAHDWLQGNEWDTIMNYDAFMEPVTWFFTGMEKHSDDFRGDLLGNAEQFWNCMTHFSSGFTMPSWQVAMNELSNHDHSRFMTRTSHKVGRTGTLGPREADSGNNKAVFREAVLLQMTWMGAPTIYYGDEAGVCGFTDPDNRRTYPWGHEDQDLIKYHRDLIAVRRMNPVLRNGSIKYVDGTRDFIAYARFNKEQQCIILINNSSSGFYRRIPVWECGTPKEGRLNTIFATNENGFGMFGPVYELKAGWLEITMDPHSAVILRYTGSY